MQNKALCKNRELLIFKERKRKMNSQQKLKEYLKSVSELESLIKNHNDNFERLKSKTNNAPRRNPPEKPEYPKTQMKRIERPVKKATDGKSIFIKILLGLFLIWLSIGEESSLILIPLGGLVILIVTTVAPIYNESQRYNQALIQYNKDLETERLRCQEEDRKAKEKIEAEHQKKLSEYELQLKKEYAEYESNLKIIAELKKILSDLRTELNILYDKNIIHPQYRNIEAVTAFYNYISTGRCTALEGPGGAYNLYEEQLKQDKSDAYIEDLKSKISELETELKNKSEQERTNRYLQVLNQGMLNHSLNLAIDRISDDIHSLNMSLY